MQLGLKLNAETRILHRLLFTHKYCPEILNPKTLLSWNFSRQFHHSAAVLVITSYVHWHTCQTALYLSFYKYSQYLLQLCHLNWKWCIYQHKSCFHIRAQGIKFHKPMNKCFKQLKFMQILYMNNMSISFTCHFICHSYTDFICRRQYCQLK